MASSIRSPHRLLTLSALLLSASACDSIPGFENPSVRVQARLWLPAAGGSANSVAPSSSGPPVGGQNIPLTELGVDDRDEDIGAYAQLGDGFSGVEFLYQGVDLFDSTPNTLPAAYGVLPEGTFVNANLDYDDFRIGYVAEVFGHEFVLGEEDEEEYVNFRLGVGAEISHRNGDLDVFGVLVPDPDLPDIVRSGAANSVDFSDNGVLFGKVRSRLSWRQFALQGEFAFSPGLSAGGQIEGPMSDTEIQARYTFFEQGVTLLVGYRRSEFEIQERVAGTQFNAEFVIDGFLVGAEFEF